MPRMPFLIALIAALALMAPAADAKPAKPVSCKRSHCWHPRPTTRPWQIQLSGDIDPTVSAPVFEVDCDATDAATVAELHRRHVKVLGYVDAGSWESYRADHDRYPAEVLGKEYPGYPDERWVDVRRRDVLVPILRDRMKVCRSKHFDGVDPDNMNGYQNDTGFPLSASDQVRFDRAIADTAHRLGLAVTLKNTGGLLARLERWFDGAVVESCFEYDECSTYERVVKARKPVYEIEYSTEPETICPRALELGFSTIFKTPALDAARRGCR